MKIKSLRKRPFLILEVMIAFVLIAFCALPLVHPHIVMVKGQKESINRMKIHHAANLIYVSVLEKMHKGDITLADIQGKKIFDISTDDLKGIDGFKATYQFTAGKHKVRDDSGFTVHKATLLLNFIPKSGNTISHEHLIFFGSRVPIDEIKCDEPGLDDEEYAGENV